jgi:protein SCO1
MTRVFAGLVAACFAATMVNFAAAAAPTAAEPPSPIVGGGPSLGGHFALKSPDGRDVTEASFPGKWLIVYFGYTSCPDECPTALNPIAAALAELGPLAAKIQPIFVTVDPKRDTPQILADYVKAFDPRILGLYGSPQETANAAKSFHVYYRTRSLGGGEYAVDHRAFIYLVNPHGQVVQLLPGDFPGHPMAAALRHLVQ